jgi:hypothetical protein
MFMKDMHYVICGTTLQRIALAITIQCSTHFQRMQKNRQATNPHSRTGFSLSIFAAYDTCSK